ncbi:MAG: 2-C-methyl-D-erythritol 2,4-cyclodiphosphate synthase [Acutalibacteraceae bacterium]
MRIGHGYDVHKLVVGRKLILGGVEISHDMGLLGHSDADVLIHAVMDALLGAAGLGDIGFHFPDTDKKHEGINSLKLLKKVYQMLKEKGYEIQNIDSIIIAQKPKLSSYIDKMRKNISEVCELEIDKINVKATTEETLGFTGRLEGISAHAVCIIN